MKPRSTHVQKYFLKKNLNKTQASHFLWFHTHNKFLSLVLQQFSDIFQSLKNSLITYFSFINIFEVLFFVGQANLGDTERSRWFQTIKIKVTITIIKNLLAMQETPVQFLAWEDPLEKGKATYSSIPAWRIPWTVQSRGSQRVRHN